MTPLTRTVLTKMSYLFTDIYISDITDIYISDITDIYISDITDIYIYYKEHIFHTHSLYIA